MIQEAYHIATQQDPVVKNSGIDMHDYVKFLDNPIKKKSESEMLGKVPSGINSCL